MVFITFKGVRDWFSTGYAFSWFSADMTQRREVLKENNPVNPRIGHYHMHQNK